MRQGEVASQGKWTGAASGGVKAPEALILPDPARRFAGTAKRLGELVSGHPMQEWLRFLMKLSEAQHHVAATLPPPTSLELAAVQQAVEARRPPLAGDGYRRNEEWRKGLALLLDCFDDYPLPPEGRSVIDRLRGRDAKAIEMLADRFLQGDVDAADVGSMLHVAAALQVNFTRMAASLPVSSLRLLPNRSLCPCCGSTPVAGLVTASGQTPGARYLYCSLCSTAWNHVRAVCVTCGGSRAVNLRAVDGGSDVVKAETCDDCGTYSKVLYQAKGMSVDPFADDLATLGLDLLVVEAGWLRHAPNPLLLAG
ncbi:MAG: formate dehydrogenase accessory protein FdhE [Proteobacteria bacterium]|nr:formate dehydrogenase accessory protein FdhE [Pseudomonadota bacterium]